MRYELGAGWCYIDWLANIYAKLFTTSELVLGTDELYLNFGMNSVALMFRLVFAVDGVD